MIIWGRILGWVIVSGYLLTVANYLVKLINRKFISGLPKNSTWRHRYQAFMRMVVKMHPFLGILTAAALVTHFIIQFLTWGFFVTGLIAGSLMLIQAVLGSYGRFIRKRKPGLWLKAHRTVAVLLLLAITFHVYTGLSMLRGS